MAHDDFADRRVLVCRVDDPRLTFRSARAHSEQHADGPILVAIGPSATDEDLARIAARHGLSLAALSAFRAAQRAPL